VFIIGHSRRERIRQIFPISRETSSTIDQIKNPTVVICGSGTYGELQIRDEAPTLRNGGGGCGQNIFLASAVLDTQRIKKSCNGRRFKEPNEPMFTLTAQDKHGVLIQHYCGDHQEDRVIDPDGISSCLPTGTGGDLIPKFVSDQRIRKLTPTECERLQSYPDGWTEGIADSNRYKCLGNSVTVNVIEAIAEKILKNI
jgi:DNA (cytosine-5)-methyltransferase 1